MTIYEEAAQAIREADAILIGAGAGMGVDSGLPDFRGKEGFWEAYPPYRKLSLDFMDLASADLFERDPAMAWGFYGHRLDLYRRTHPHRGFKILRSWIERPWRGSFVFTSNVDGQFQKSGFNPDRIVEIHGSIHRLQCDTCGYVPIDASLYSVDVNPETMRAIPPWPRCMICDGLLRPSIIMFCDTHCDSTAITAQRDRLDQWMRTLSKWRRLVIIEIGAGVAIPTVRMTCEAIAQQQFTTMIRINPRDLNGTLHDPRYKIAAGGFEGLRRIDEANPLTKEMS